MPKLFNFKVGDEVVVDNYQGTKDDYFVGYKGEIVDLIETGTYDYGVLIYHNGHSARSNFKESELRKLNKYNFRPGDMVTNKATGEVGMIGLIDHENEQVEIQYIDSSMEVVSLNKLELCEEAKYDHSLDAVNFDDEDEFEIDSEPSYFEEKGLEIGQLVNLKQKAYGDSIGKAYKLMQIYLENYDNGDSTYTIPKSLLQHILLQVRIIDKQNRIFSNPDGDLMEENGYADTVGYGLLGMRMFDGKNSK